MRINGFVLKARWMIRMIPSSFQDENLFGMFPDTSCLANFRLSRLDLNGSRVCDPQQLRQIEGVRNSLQRLKIGCAAAHPAALRFYLPMLVRKSFSSRATARQRRRGFLVRETEMRNLQTPSAKSSLVSELFDFKFRTVFQIRQNVFVFGLNAPCLEVPPIPTWKKLG